MTATDERHLESVDGERDRRTTTQVELELGAPPRWRDAVIDLKEIHVEAFGSPPEQALISSIEKFGVLEPVLLDGTTRDDRYTVHDGRRRVLAAIRAGLEEIPARVLTEGNLSLLAGALPLASNDPRSPNPVIELEAIEDLIRNHPGIRLPKIASGIGVSLKTLRARMKLSNLRFELRDAWKAGRFGTKVGEAAARCNETQQAELKARLEANGTLTIQDVKDVRKIGVTSHQRTTTEDRKYERAAEQLKEIRKSLFLDLGEKHPAMEALADAIDALENETG